MNAAPPLISLARNVKALMSGILRQMFAALKLIKPALHAQLTEFGMQFREYVVTPPILNARTVKVKINGILFFQFAALTFMTQQLHHVNAQLEITILRRTSAALNHMILKLSPAFAQVEITMKCRTLAVHLLHAAAALSLRPGTIS